MTTTHDPYATEAETDALLAADTRTPAERRLAALFDQHGGNEQGAEPEAVLRRIAVELIESAALASPQPAQDQGLIATLAGLEASTGHLSGIVDQQRALLAEVEDVFGRDERGIPFEDGESRLIDKVRAHLACIAAPQAPQPLTADKIRPAFEHWFSEGGKWPAAIWREGAGYSLMQTQSAWNAWQAAHGITKGPAA